MKRPSWLIEATFSSDRSGERRKLALTPLRNGSVPLARETYLAAFGESTMPDRRA